MSALDAADLLFFLVPAVVVVTFGGLLVYASDEYFGTDDTKRRQAKVT